MPGYEHKQTKTRPAFILMEFMIGLTLVMLLVVILFTTIGKAREAQTMMAMRRLAVYKAESQLAQMQVPGQKSKQQSDVDKQITIHTLNEPVSDQRYIWVRVTAFESGQQASLIGLVCREYVGDQP